MLHPNSKVVRFQQVHARPSTTAEALVKKSDDFLADLMRLCTEFAKEKIPGASLMSEEQLRLAAIGFANQRLLTLGIQLNALPFQPLR